MKTPYLKFHPEKLISNYKNFQSICEKNFNNNFQICFSTKTNTNPLTIQSLKKLKSGFEVVSLRELKLTPKESFKVMNGPAKTKEELRYAIKNNVLIFIDSFSEIKKINELKEKPKLGIRLGNPSTKFGFSHSQLKEAFKKINPIAIQLHQGTLNKFSEFKKNLKEQHKIIKPFLKEIKYLNFGGGFPDNFQLKNLSLTLNDYLEEIKNTFKEFKGTYIFEPGRNIVADAYTLTTKVITIKEKDNISYAILDAGINILPKITLANFKFNKISKTKIKEKPKTYTLAGPLLFNNDIVGKYFGILKEEDLFEVENVGAYCENLGWEIIYEKVKVIK